MKVNKDGTVTISMAEMIAIHSLAINDDYIPDDEDSMDLIAKFSANELYLCFAHGEEIREIVEEKAKESQEMLDIVQFHMFSTGIKPS